MIQIVRESDDEVVVEAALGEARQTEGAITMVTSSGATVTSESVKWTYIDRGLISSVVPDKGRVGTRVTIFGVDICGGGESVVKVTLASYDADITDNAECGVIYVDTKDYGVSVTGDVP